MAGAFSTSAGAWSARCKWLELLRNGLATDAAGGVGVLEAMLEMADSSITYRSRYLTSLQVDLVLDLLLVDEANPRSIAFQLARLAGAYRTSFPAARLRSGGPPKRAWRCRC